MKRVSISLVIYLMMMSCGVEPSEIGSDFFTGGALDFAYIDSSSVNLSTVQYEKLATSSSSRILLGSYRDDKLGMVKSSGFIQLNPTTSIELKDEDITYDYLSLVLKYDKYYYYDTAQLTLNVHRVAVQMDLEDGSLYNTSSFTIYNEPLASVTFLPRPHRDDSVEVKLTDVLGKEIFNKAVTNDEDLTTTNFTKYIRGLALIPDTTLSKGIIGFATAPELRLYYTDRSETPVQQKYVSIKADRYFSRVQSITTQTKLQSVPADEHLDASVTDDEAYLQSGVGLGLRVDLPYLRDLKQNTNFYPIRAQLEIYPVRKSFSKDTPLPQTLTVYVVDQYNAVYQQMATQATFVEDVELGRDSKYVLDVTDFVKSQMELPRFRGDALLFTNSDFISSVDRLYAASHSHSYNTQLKIYYTTINNQ